VIVRMRERGGGGGELVVVVWGVRAKNLRLGGWWGRAVVLWDFLQTLAKPHTHTCTTGVRLALLGARMRERGARLRWTEKAKKTRWKRPALPRTTTPPPLSPSLHHPARASTRTHIQKKHKSYTVPLRSIPPTLPTALHLQKRCKKTSKRTKKNKQKKIITTHTWPPCRPCSSGWPPGPRRTRLPGLLPPQTGR
jgi:hypothetical protein